MRKITFRGRTLNGEWVYGSLFHDTRDDTFHIWDEVVKYWVRVDPATVGQFTGLKDKNGSEIYEGDILHLWRDEPDCAVCYWQGMFLLEDRHEGDSDCLNEHNEYSEAFGSIHDNPELLKEE